MLDLMHQAGQALYKRASETPGDAPGSGYQLPPWAALVFLLDFLILTPAFVFLAYSLGELYPVLTIVEDERPPAYEPVALDESADPSAGSTIKPTDGNPAPITSSMRSTNRLLRSVGGWTSNFRGVGCYLAQVAMINVLTGIFSGVLMSPVFVPIVSLLATLCLVQFSTAWVHIVISQPSELRFWQRLPRFGPVFKATWRPVILYWAACQLRNWLPMILAVVGAVSMPKLKVGDHYDVPAVNAAYVFGILGIVAIYILVAVFVVIPAHVVLIRVQASLLPEGEDPIIPFDRSFHGQVQTTLVGGRGYATVKEAWSTFSRAAWRRLVFLYAKIFGFYWLFFIALSAMAVPEAVLMAQAVDKGEAAGDLKL